MTETGSDIVEGDWVDRRLPEFIRPYARLARWDRAIGTWLLLLPCWWGVALFGHGSDLDMTELLILAGLFAIGAKAMRGAGCTWNDITDRHIDGKVSRTATRPIPSGQVSVPRALIFIALQCLIGLIVLSQFSLLSILVALTSLCVVVIYPFMKRFTYFPQLFLGIAFNWGVLVAGAEIIGHYEIQIILLYLAGICWTMSYDTIYAHQDKEDDILIGVKSTALRFGAQTRPIIACFMGASLCLIAAAAWSHGATGGLFWMGLAGAVLHFGWQLKNLDFDDPSNLARHFRGNRDTGLLVMIALALGTIYP